MSKWNSPRVAFVSALVSIVSFAAFVASCTLGGQEKVANTAPVVAGGAAGTATGNAGIGDLVTLAVKAGLAPYADRLAQVEAAGIPKDTTLSWSQIVQLMFGGSGAVAAVIAALKAHAAQSNSSDHSDQLSALIDALTKAGVKLPPGLVGAPAAASPPA